MDDVNMKTDWRDYVGETRGVELRAEGVAGTPRPKRWDLGDQRGSKTEAHVAEERRGASYSFHHHMFYGELGLKPAIAGFFPESDACGHKYIPLHP